jgi:hypothetical protein
MFTKTDTITFTETNIYIIRYLLIRAITNTKLIMTISLVVIYKGMLICFTTTEHILPQFLL